MNPQQPDQIQRTLADLDARLGRITAEIAEVRAGLSALGGRVGATPVPPPSPPPHPQGAWGRDDSMWRPGAPPPGPVPTPAGGPWRPGQAQPAPAPAQAAGPWRPGPAQGQPGPDTRLPEPARRRPARRPRVNAATIIAAIGGAVMLAGVAFLLVVAIQAGLFPPIARAVGAAILAVVLVGLGLWLQSRHDATDSRPVNPGALALVGTGLAAAMLDVIASTVLYRWIPVPAAYMFVGGLALIGFALAQRWSSAVLACLVGAGTMALSPLISHGVELPIFYVIIGIAMAVLAAELGRVVRVVWSVPPALMLTGYLGASGGTTGRGEVIALVAAALAFAAVAAGVAWYDSFRRSPVIEHAALVVVPGAIPLLVLPTLGLTAPGWPVGLLLAAAYLVMSVLIGRAAGGGAGAVDADGARKGAGRLLAAVTGAVGSVLLVAAWGELDGRAPTGLAITLTAIAYMFAAGQWSRRWLDWAAGIISGLALVTYLGVNQPYLALGERLAVRNFTYIDVVASFAVAVLAVAVTRWARRRRPAAATRVVMVGAVVALAAFSVQLVAAGVVIGDLSGHARNGFLAAHLVVTVLWICCAAWLVLTASPRVADARTLGFVLGGLALAKLLFLDLATLPGLFRVLAFIVVGGVMLAVAVRYRKDTEPSGSGSPT